MALDVRSRESVQGAAREVERRHGRLDILVNNAGILPEAGTETDAAPSGAFVDRQGNVAW